MLRDTSRSFFLTLRLLPGAVRSQIGLAYLLARTTDTVADTDLVSVERRLEALSMLRDRVLGRRTAPLDLRAFVTAGDSEGKGGSSDAERSLLLRCEESIDALRVFSEEDQRRVEWVIDIITSGQELDLRRFAGVTPGGLISLNTREEIEDYTYRVAGCVGAFWTQMCDAHLFGPQRWDSAAQMKEGVLYGKGLQWVNILRDVPRDLRNGRCYIPREDLHSVGLVPEQLLNPEAVTALRPLYDSYLKLTEEYLRSGWSYTLRIPRSSLRLRMACALPILIGVKTLGLLRTGNPLDPSVRIKVSRSMVRQALWRSLWAALGGLSWDQVMRWAAAKPGAR